VSADGGPYALLLWYSQLAPVNVTGNSCSVIMRDTEFEGWPVADVFMAGVQLHFAEINGQLLHVADNDLSLDIRDADACKSSGATFVSGVAPGSTQIPDGVNLQPANIFLTHEDNACLDF